MRGLTDREISTLEEQGCTAEEWSEIIVDDDFSTDSIRNVMFYGHIEIGSLNSTITVEDGFIRRCIIRNATLNNVTIGDGCLIENIRGYISNYSIGEKCYISDVGIITTQGATNFSQGNVISVLNEGGDGNIVLFDRLTSQLAWLMVKNNSVLKFIKKETTQRGCQDKGSIGDSARITGVKEISNVIVGEYCEIQGTSKIADSTLISCEDAPTLIGTDAVIENSIVASGANIIDGAKIDNCFIGESVHIGKGFSAESSLFFANSYMDNGESCASFCGPFSTSHHKSTLLIGGMFSFYNAGSGTNQSNHAYKMGPIHWGVLDRGSKTASGSHILWPAKIGSFSMVMGKVASHPDTVNLPFSYIIADGNETYLAPGINIKTVGTWRDVGKWHKRDLRPEITKQDLINFDFPNPYVIQQVVKGKQILRQLVEEQGESTEVYSYGNCLIKRTALLRGLKFYDLAIRLFIYKCLHSKKYSLDDMDKNEDFTTMEWMDISGLLAPKSEIDRLEKDIENGNVSDIDEILTILRQIGDDYYRNEKSFAISVMQSEASNMFIDIERWRKEAEESYSLWLKMIRDDAEKEFLLGDVEENILRNFIEGVK